MQFLKICGIKWEQRKKSLCDLWAAARYFLGKAPLSVTRLTLCVLCTKSNYGREQSQTPNESYKLILCPVCGPIIWVALRVFSFLSPCFFLSQSKEENPRKASYKVLALLLFSSALAKILSLFSLCFVSCANKAFSLLWQRQNFPQQTEASKTNKSSSSEFVFKMDCIFLICCFCAPLPCFVRGADAYLIKMSRYSARINSIREHARTHYIQLGDSYLLWLVLE